MGLLILYVLLALGFSFLCSIAEAVILSVNTAYISLLEQQDRRAGRMLRSLKEDINKPLAAVLTLNTIAHTVGAAGAGAQAASVFGSAFVGVASAVLTLLILVFSEIIPKTLGAHYWKRLAPVTAYMLKYLVWLLYPFVLLSESLTRGFSETPTLTGYSREEFSAMAEISAQEGKITQQELDMLKNILNLQETMVKHAMTPRSVVFSLSEDLTVEEFIHKYDRIRFSRIPIYAKDPEHISGFVLRSDLLLAQTRGNSRNTLKNYCRELPVLLDTMSLSLAFDTLIRKRSHILLVVDEYGSVKGILTLEDVLETILGLEIVDEGDRTVDMQKLARRLWKQRALGMGLDISE